ncbi:hypothetical protein NliqN6_5865 [Naganishia liquefaciens]|uniref:Elongator complex protein 5 n=1 Tax=Naganishia liquefaciens TaxID=104408 RepID=A0A8H3TZ30_9TREE|nr:hypothetical protein NliqN6_5865 [Naganishia liquefaciens]
MSLPAILANTQTPHQPFLIICDTPTLPAHALIRDLVRRNIADASPVAFVSVIHPPSTYGLDPSHTNVRILDLTDDAERYFTDSPRDTFSHLETWLRDTVDELGRGVQVYIDALDVLVEDYASFSRGVKVVKMVLQLLRTQKAPSRLILPLPSSTPLLNSLLTPSTSPALSLLTLHPPSLISHLAETYLTTPPPSGHLDADPQGMKFWSLLVTADGPGSAGWSGGQAGDIKGKGRARGEAVVRSLLGESDESAEAEAVVVQVLVRKQQGGANKGMSRGLEAVRWGAGAEGMVPCAWNEVEGLRSLGKGYVLESETVEERHPSQQHIPFNLSLTASQQASRAQVPIPYAHEGDEPSTPREPAALGGIIFEPGSEDDMDDDDPDEDLDF